LRGLIEGRVVVGVEGEGFHPEAHRRAAIAGRDGFIEPLINILVAAGRFHRARPKYGRSSRSSLRP